MQLDTKSLDESLEYFRNQVNYVTYKNEEGPQRNFFHTLLEPPYLYMILVFVSVFILLLYTQPGFIMNETIIPMFDINTQDQVKSQLNINYGRLIMIEKIQEDLCKGVLITKNKEHYNKEVLFDVFTKFELYEYDNDFVF